LISKAMHFFATETERITAAEAALAALGPPPVPSLRAGRKIGPTREIAGLIANNPR
jgi:hypothetical protein